MSDLLLWQPCSLPNLRSLLGHYVRLEALTPAQHGPALWQALQHPEPHQWTYMAYGPFPNQAHFQQWLESLAGKADPLFYCIVDATNGTPQGLIAYLRIAAHDGCIEIGHLNFSPRLQRTPAASEAVFLLLQEAFDGLGYRRVEWKCNADNLRSIRAAERYGFIYEGLFRQHMVVKGKNRDSVWLAMLDQDWPINRQAFEQWLAVDNFDTQGQQIHSLNHWRHRLGAK